MGRWQEKWLNRRMLLCVLHGFSSGLPLYLLFQMVPAWLRSEQVDLATIGLFALVGIPYTWKFLWSPLLDRYIPLPMGRRRSWLLLAQLALFAGIGLTGHFSPQQSLGSIVVLVTLVAFFSATQDIVIDAYRRELLPDDELGLGTALYTNAYRLSSLVPGSLGLILADHLPWSSVFWVVAAFMGVGLFTTLWMPEMVEDDQRPRSLREAVVAPFREFVQRDGGWRQALWILAFMVLYKLGDSMATALSTPFYLDLGFSLTEIGATAKLAALWASTAGTLIGGALMLRLRIAQALWLFGLVQIASIPGFAILSMVGPDPWLLFAVVSFEYLGVGLGTVALTAFLAGQTSRLFTATQFALFTSLAALPRTFANATTGFIVEKIGYTDFFWLCTILAIPGLLLLPKVAPWRNNETTIPRKEEST